MIPLRDVIPSRTIPVVTLGLIAVNTVVFLYEWWIPVPELDMLLATYGVIPIVFDWVSVLTSMFLHGGVVHFAGNMLYLWIFGDNVEDRLGHARFAVFYVLCGAAAAVAQAAAAPLSAVPMVGASGAIAGVMGAYLILFPRSRVLTLIPLVFFWEILEIPAIFFLVLWFFLQLFSGVGSMGAQTAQATGGIAFWAHVAGFVAGVLAVYALRRPERQRAEWWDVV